MPLMMTAQQVGFSIGVLNRRPSHFVVHATTGASTPTWAKELPGAIATAIASKLLPQIARLLSVDDSGTSVLSDAAYEDMARLKLPAILLERCGLEVVRGADASRTGLEGLEWDFRVPVLIAATQPHPNSSAGVFETFPRKAFYTRPPAIEARIVSPTHSSGAETGSSAYYLAILEVTVASKWTHRSSSREGLLERLEQRLFLSVERAFSNGLISTRKVTDLVAVVGVVAPEPYSESVRSRMAEPGVLPLLKAMMEAGRFVFIGLPKLSQEPAGVGPGGDGGASSSSPAHVLSGPSQSMDPTSRCSTAQLRQGLKWSACPEPKS